MKSDIILGSATLIWSESNAHEIFVRKKAPLMLTDRDICPITPLPGQLMLIFVDFDLD
jgi:hypothetical protein